MTTTMATTHQVTGLASSTTHFYRCRGTNASGNGPYSAVVSATSAATGGGSTSSYSQGFEDLTDGGWTIDETVEAVRLVAAHGADLVDISSGGNVADARIPVGPGYQVPFAARIRAETGVPTAAVGMIDSAAQAEQILVTGQADVVLSGREMLRNPHFALRAARDLDADLSATPPQLTRGFA